MRIIGGTWRGRNLTAPVGPGTRPTADRARQTLFDMIAHAPWVREAPLAGAEILDAFAGTGALGLEALSRGAGQAVFMENERAAIRTLLANIERCKAGERARVLACDALRPPRALSAARYVFLDPPYENDVVAHAVEALQEAGWIAGGTIVVAETPRDRLVTLAGELAADRVVGVARIRVYLR